MYDNDAVHIDIEEFAAHMAEVRIDTLYAEQYEAEIQENYSALYDNLKQGLYNAAFECAQMLRKLYFSKYMDTIISCYRKCAENDVPDAMLELVRLSVDRRTQSIKGEAFPYLKRLSELGYIESFHWLGDCYYYGLGCEKDLKKASHCYLEAYLFGGSYEYKEKMRQINADLEFYNGDDPVKCLLKTLLFNEDRLAFNCASDDIALLVLQGKIKEYPPENGYIILRKGWCGGGITSLRLGECLLRGIGTEPNPAAAQYVLEEGEWDLDNEFYWYEEDDLNETEIQIFENNYKEAQNMFHELQAEAENKVRELQGKEGFVAVDEALEDWKSEEIIKIKRNTVVKE